MDSGPAGTLGRLPDEVQPRRESHGRGRLRSPPRPLLLPARRSARCHYRPTATTQSLYGTPLLQLTPSPGDTPIAHTRSDDLGDAAELRVTDSVTRYSHADWNREQRAEPTCHATIRYIPIGRPMALPPDFLACYPSHKRSSLSDIQELAGKGRLHTTDDDIVLLVRSPTLPPTRSDKPNSVGRAAYLLNHEPVRIYVPLLMRPWIMQACHSTAFCHLGTMRTLCMLERFYWWIGMNVCTRWWLRHCLMCQARKNPPLTVRWPIISMPLPEGPGVAVSADYVGPLPVTPPGNTSCCSSIASVAGPTCSPVTAAEFTAEGTANILVHQYILLWGCPRTILSYNGLQFCSKPSLAVHQLFGVHKLATSSYHTNCNGGVKRINHTMAQMLAMIVNERQDDGDSHMPHVEIAYNSSVGAATGLAPNEVHMGRLPRLPLTVSNRTSVVGH